MRLPSLIRLVLFIAIAAFAGVGQVQAQRPNVVAFLEQWDTDHDGTLSVDEIKRGLPLHGFNSWTANTRGN
jgi:hypothetical protein